jgi:DNA polymerase elongation subunit (family B)
MANFYTDVSILGNSILYKGVDNGKRVQYKQEYSPKIYVKSNKQSEWKNLFGQSVEEIEPGNISETRDFIKRYSDVDNFEIYGDIGFDVQFISEKFTGLIDWDMDHINSFVVDIETATEQSGFPNPNYAVEEILLITMKNMKTKLNTTFMSREYTGDKIENCDLILCQDEYSLLTRFIDFWKQSNVDIVTGWNVEGFDIKYIINRCKQIIGEDRTRELSPWGRIKERNTKDGYGKPTTLFEIVGVPVVDFRDLYKKFTYTKQENYRLETIAQVELGSGKLDHSEFETFKDFYTNGWDKFVLYNTIDCDRVDELEDKMKLIELCLTMSYLAKVNYGDVFSQIRMWDSIIFNHLKLKKVVIPPRSKNSKNEQFEGAFVREPVPGFYNWVSSFDATSLYPSIIQTWNISLETFVGMYSGHITTKGLLNQDYKFSDEYTVAANGAMYRKDKVGMMPELIDIYMKKRKEAKSTMLKYESEMEVLKSNKNHSKVEYKKLQNFISKYNNEQMAFKIAMNSLYGALGNAFFRYYTLENARAVTLSGQYIIISVGEHVDKKLNSMFKMDYPWVIYQDTDSIYLSLEPIVNKFYSGKSAKEIIPVLSKICKEKIDPIINDCCYNLQRYTNVNRDCISFKLEGISSNGFWTGKKRYALNVYENEGVVYNEPKLKIMGLEVIKSSTPKIIREKLKQSVSLILNGTESDIQDFVEDVKSEFKSMSINEIAFPRGVNGIGKYSDDKTIYGFKCPIHTKGSLLYNNKLRELKLDNKYPMIGEGDSIKYVFLKTPNPLKDEVVSFLADLPEEFGLNKYVDYDTQYEKTFLDPLNGMLEAVGWSHEKKFSIDDFFS